MGYTPLPASHPIFIFFPSHLCIFCKYGINIEKRTYGNGIFFPSTSSTEKIIRAAVPAPLKSTHFFSLPRHLPFVSANPSFTAHSAIHILRFIGVRAECLSKILSFVFRTHHQGCLGVPIITAHKLETLGYSVGQSNVCRPVV